MSSSYVSTAGLMDAYLDKKLSGDEFVEVMCMLGNEDRARRLSRVAASKRVGPPRSVAPGTIMSSTSIGRVNAPMEGRASMPGPSTNDRPTQKKSTKALTRGQLLPEVAREWDAENGFGPDQRRSSSETSSADSSVFEMPTAERSPTSDPAGQVAECELFAFIDFDQCQEC